MAATDNLGLRVYQTGEKFRILDATNSFNNNMELIDDMAQAHDDSFADAYDATEIYQEGALCIHENKLYKRNSWGSDTPIAETWNSAHWTAKSLAEIIGGIQDEIGNTALPTTAQTLSGAIAEHEGDIGAQSEAIANLQDGLAIVATGNTHAAIPAGAFVYVKGHGTLADGLYTNTSGSTIAQDATLSSSNLTADASGGLNVLNNNLTWKAMPSDMNNATSNCRGYGVFTNAPVSGSGGYALCILNTNDATGRIEFWNGYDSGSLYFRVYSGGAWKKWRKLAYPVNNDECSESTYSTKTRNTWVNTGITINRLYGYIIRIGQTDGYTDTQYIPGNILVKYDSTKGYSLCSHGKTLADKVLLSAGAYNGQLGVYIGGTAFSSSTDATIRVEQVTW